jgi:hypothetical protein
VEDTGVWENKHPARIHHSSVYPVVYLLCFFRYPYTVFGLAFQLRGNVDYLYLYQYYERDTVQVCFLSLRTNLVISFVVERLIASVEGPVMQPHAINRSTMKEKFP